MQPYAIRFTSLDNKTMQTQSKKGYLQHSIAKMRRKVQTIKDCSIFMDNNIAKSIVQNCTALQQCSAVIDNSQNFIQSKKFSVRLLRRGIRFPVHHI